MSKKTLLMTHGYSMASVYFAKLLPGLAKHYRIVMFDNMGWGLNTRTEEVGDALESPEKAERYMLEWWEKLIEALGDTLPPKFYLSGHSAGGAFSMLYACHHPERLAGLFLQSPACIEDTTAPDFVYDPYTIRIKDHSAAVPSRREVDKALYKFSNKIHMFSDLDYVPYCVTYRIFKGFIRKLLPRKFFTDEEALAYSEFYSLMIQRLSKVEVVGLASVDYFAFFNKPLHTKDRML